MKKWIVLGIITLFSYGGINNCWCIITILNEEGFDRPITNLSRDLEKIPDFEKLEDLAIDSSSLLPKLERFIPPLKRETQEENLSVADHAAASASAATEDWVTEGCKRDVVRRNCILLEKLLNDFANALKKRSRELTGLVYQEKWGPFPIRAWRASRSNSQKITENIHGQIMVVNIWKEAAKKKLEQLNKIEKQLILICLSDWKEIRTFVNSQTVQAYLKQEFSDTDSMGIVQQFIREHMERIQTKLQHIDEFLESCKTCEKSTQTFHTDGKRFKKGWGFRPYYYFQEEQGSEDSLFGFPFPDSMPEVDEESSGSAAFYLELKAREDIKRVYKQIKDKLEILSKIITLLNQRKNISEIFD
jgi:hypothetical protein